MDGVDVRDAHLIVMISIVISLLMSAFTCIATASLVAYQLFK